MKRVNELQKYQIKELCINKITGGDVLRNLKNTEDEGDME